MSHTRVDLIEHMFDTRGMLSLHDVEGSRRSLAMAPLSRAESDRLLDTCSQLLQERAQITALLERLPNSFGEVRQLLNELQLLIR